MKAIKKTHEYNLKDQLIIVSKCSGEVMEAVVQGDRTVKDIKAMYKTICKIDIIIYRGDATIKSEYLLKKVIG